MLNNFKINTEEAATLIKQNGSEVEVHFTQLGRLKNEEIIMSYGVDPKFSVVLCKNEADYETNPYCAQISISPMLLKRVAQE